MAFQKFGPNRVDANLTKTTALPNGAAAVNSDSIDLGHTEEGAAPPCELELVAPALATADLPDTKTMIYILEDSADDSSFAVLATSQVILTQLGAGGAGDVAETTRIGIPSNCRRYIRVTATNSGTGDASDKSMIHTVYPRQLKS